MCNQYWVRAWIYRSQPQKYVHVLICWRYRQDCVCFRVPHRVTFQYSSLVWIFATNALSRLCVHRELQCRLLQATGPQLKDQFAEFLLAHHQFFFGPILTLVPPPPLNPTALPVMVPSLPSLLVVTSWSDLASQRSQGCGQVIVTVPALGCPGVSTWDLTRHRLTSLPYWPVAGSRLGNNVTWGGGKNQSVAVTSGLVWLIQTVVLTHELVCLLSSNVSSNSLQ